MTERFNPVNCSEWQEKCRRLHEESWKIVGSESQVTPPQDVTKQAIF